MKIKKNAFSTLVFNLPIQIQLLDIENPKIQKSTSPNAQYATQVLLPAILHLGHVGRLANSTENCNILHSKRIIGTVNYCEQISFVFASIGNLARKYLIGQSHGKNCEIITLDQRLDPNCCSPTVFKILKSPV
jgi:hypothetical protein